MVCVEMIFAFAFIYKNGWNLKINIIFPLNVMNFNNTALGTIRQACELSPTRKKNPFHFCRSFSTFFPFVIYYTRFS